MDADELKRVLDGWGINAAEAAKILCVHSNRMSEYLGDVSRIPCSLAFTIELLSMLDPAQRDELFEQRRNRLPHSG